MEKILCIDDEISVLEGFRRQLRRQFDLVMATSGEEGLECLRRRGPFPVIICDMRMPGMDGIHFFAKAKESVPDSVRIMFTGDADLPMAIHAVNEGNIFRFLTKPCSPEVLVKAVEAGIVQYRLITAERLLLENTLKASVQVLVDTLGMTNPLAFSRAMRLRFYAAQIAKALRLPDLWKFEVAAMLSQIGCVTIPCETLEKLYAGETLSTVEQNMVASYPALGSQWIARIPRLEPIAEMIARQQESPATVEIGTSDPMDIGGIGAQIIKVVLEFDILLSRGLSSSQAVCKLADQPTLYHEALTEVLPCVKVLTTEKTSRVVKVSGLRNGLILSEDMRTTHGLLVVCKDQEVNDALRERLKNFASQGLIADSVRVTVVNSFANTGIRFPQ
jgi:response regulator RpfG family c-di-GMP phosphodiesterase